MYRYKSVLVLPVVFFLILLAPVAFVQPVKAQFVIASWTFPDEYGQGIEGFEIFSNNTGSWVQFGSYYTADDSFTIDWNVTVGIKLRCYTWFNSSLTGAGSENEGKLLQRHNVTVRDSSDTVVFSQQNFTYYSSDDGIDPPLWLYGYEVVLNFLPDYGQFYTVIVFYEIYW